jgi:hypothetical protein
MTCQQNVRRLVFSVFYERSLVVPELGWTKILWDVEILGDKLLYLKLRTLQNLQKQLAKLTKSTVLKN